MNSKNPSFGKKGIAAVNYPGGSCILGVECEPSNNSHLKLKKLVKKLRVEPNEG